MTGCDVTLSRGQFKTGNDRFPVNLVLEYENNLNAADHPLDAVSNPTNLGKQSHGYLVDCQPRPSEE